MVDGFRFEVFRRGKDVGGVDAAVEFGFSGTGYEGDFMTVIGTRGFDEFFLDFNAADGTQREGVFDALVLWLRGMFQFGEQVFV